MSRARHKKHHHPKEHHMEESHMEEKKHGGKVHHHHAEGEHAKHRADKRARGGDTKAFNVPSGGVSAHGRQIAKSKGETMPGTGGKFPIRNLSDLAKAKHDIGRTNEPRSKVVSWINRRAKELGGRKVGES